MGDAPHGRTERAAAVLLAGGRAVVRALPRRWVKALDDRLFAAIFQATRVTNDAYGWRPERPEGTEPGGEAKGG